MEIIGVLELSRGLLCREEILGKSFKGCIAGIEIEICFPEYNRHSNGSGLRSESNERTLEPPRIANNVRRGDEKLDWGRVYRFPKMLFWVNRLAIRYECEESDFEKTADTVYESIQRWEKSLIEYCCICTKYLLPESCFTGSNPSRLELMAKGEYIHQNSYLTFSVLFPDENNALSLEQMKQAVEFASSGKELYLQYQMMLESYAARNEGRYRQAVIDACSAFELCLTQRISVFCREKGIKESIILDKYRYLNDKVNLLHEIDPSFDKTGIKERIITLRNGVAHNRNVYPSKEETDELISRIEVSLQYFFDGYC